MWFILLPKESRDVTLVWDDGKRVKAHKDKLCRGRADSERELIVRNTCSQIITCNAM